MQNAKERDEGYFDLGWVVRVTTHACNISVVLDKLTGWDGWTPRMFRCGEVCRVRSEDGREFPDLKIRVEDVYCGVKPSPPSLPIRRGELCILIAPKAHCYFSGSYLPVGSGRKMR